MARTWSVPQRESYAGFGGSRRLSADIANGIGFSQRGPLLLVAALLTLAGAVVPQLDADSLSTLLFVVGAGLAAMVVMLPARGARKPAPSFAREAQTPSQPSAFDARAQPRFPELFGADASQSALDRAAWAKLTAHMSHELRTPLNAVLGFSEIMTKEVFGPLGSGYDAYARDIHASGRILLKSAEDALAITALLTAPECKGRQTSRLTSVIDEACAFAAPDLAVRSISIVRNTDAGFDVLGDHQAMRQLLINLLSEAGRNGAANTTLRIETKSLAGAIDLSIAIQADRRGPTADEGFGMILARTLCELSGAELATSAGNGERKWTVRLLPAAQHDLFLAA
ncbi:sensor histidine kinase [Hyphomicrobium facile]|uniref:histidine kinase n=1 Tax=Hyphomicrobium facile TaxID=51670 RepID=A0A1I7NWX2_9HYPH|nr:HAMP domain-containing sensor histidine kinase [Hyphomicrobium facile]SFV39165.1 two-component system, cell cycle sensor histidine kinase PleC [Hyphomicrobium facile]